MNVVLAQQNETLDALVFRITGSSNLVEQVYQANPNLADLGINLPHGTAVNIPDTTTAKIKTIKRQTLW